MNAVGFIDPASLGRARWIGAAAAVVLLHAASIAVAVIGLPEEVQEEPEGSVLMELAPIPVSASIDALDMPPGQLVETIDPVTPKELEPEPIEDELPEIEPSPLAPEPEVALPALRPVEQVREPKEVETQTPTLDDSTQSQEAVVPQQAAPPPAVATAAAVTAATKQGTSATAQSETSWQKMIVTELGKHRRYPAQARAARQEGEVVVRFTVDRKGQVIASSVIKSSGWDLLDEEALAVLKRASPLPEPPDELAGATFDLEIPIRFRIRWN